MNSSPISDSTVNAKTSVIRRETLSSPASLVFPFRMWIGSGGGPLIVQRKEVVYRKKRRQLRKFRTWDEGTGGREFPHHSLS